MGNSWVVYRVKLRGQRNARLAVCEQAVWDELHLDKTGYHTLVKAGIASEREAELLARGMTGDRTPQ